MHHFFHLSFTVKKKPRKDFAAERTWSDSLGDAFKGTGEERPGNIAADQNRGNAIRTGKPGTPDDDPADECDHGDQKVGEGVERELCVSLCLLLFRCLVREPDDINVHQDIRTGTDGHQYAVDRLRVAQSMDAFKKDSKDDEEQECKGERGTPGPYPVFQVRMFAHDPKNRQREKRIHTVKEGVEQVAQESEAAGDECADPCDGRSKDRHETRALVERFFAETILRVFAREKLTARIVVDMMVSVVVMPVRTGVRHGVLLSRWVCVAPYHTLVKNQ